MSFHFLLDLPPDDEPAQNPVLSEHSYCKNWKSIPALRKCQPRKTALFNMPRTRDSQSEPIEPREVDVEAVAAEEARHECVVDWAEWRGEHCMLYKLQLIGVAECPDPDQWEEQVSRSGWTMQHNRLFDSLVRMLMNDVLASSVTQSLSRWDAHRCLQVKRLSRGMRKLFGLYQWDRVFLLRAHTALIHHLPLRVLASYVDGLAALNRRRPALVQQTLLSGGGVGERLALGLGGGSGSFGRSNITGQVRELVVGAAEPDSLERRLSRAEQLAVQPALPASAPEPPLGQSAPRLSLVLLSGLPAASPRLTSLAAVLGRVGRVHIVEGRPAPGSSVSEHCRQVLVKFRAQLNQSDRGDHRVLAVCLGPSACLAGTYLLCTVQRRGQLPACVAGCVLVGPPTRDIFGRRGFPEDHLLHHSLPSLLLLGTETGFACPDELDWLRQRWPAKSRLVLFPGCDHYLRAGHRWLRALRLCQAGVDARAAGEVADFARREVFGLGGRQRRHGGALAAAASAADDFDDDDDRGSVGSEDTADAVPSPAGASGVDSPTSSVATPAAAATVVSHIPLTMAAFSSTSSTAPATPTSGFSFAGGVGKKRKQRLQDRLPVKFAAYPAGGIGAVAPISPFDPIGLPSTAAAAAATASSGFRFGVEEPVPLDERETANAINSILG